VIGGVFGQGERLRPHLNGATTINKQKHVEPIPEEFDSYEEAAEFWDTHDTTDYPDAFRTVDVETTFRGRYYEIEIEADVVEVLQAQARRKASRSAIWQAIFSTNNLRPRNHNATDFA